MIASRRIASAQRSKARRPSPSGPRCRSSSPASSAGGGPSFASSPRIPHMRGLSPNPGTIGRVSGVRYSIVVPVYDEQDTIPELLPRLAAVLDGLDGESEVLFVDDGSSDRTSVLLVEAQRRDPRLKLIRLARNFGHQIAISAGLDFAL